MKVLFLSTYFPRPSNTRMGTWSLDHAVALRDAGMEVKVISLTPWFPQWLGAAWSAVRTYSDCPQTAELNRIRVRYPRWLCYPIKQFRRVMSWAPWIFMTVGWWSARGMLLRLIDEWKPNVVLANHSLVSGFVAMKLRQQRGLPYVTVDHEVGDFICCHTNARHGALLRSVMHDASRSVTVSRAMQRMAEDVVSEGQFVTIYNGAGFAPCSVEYLERHVKKSDLRIFCCGNLYGRKDIPLLVNAFAKIAEEFPGTQLRIAGDGPDRQEVESLIQSLPCRQQIYLLGSIEHSAVQQEMLAADVFALVGWAEPFGVVFLEAMANGCPVVVCDDAGVAEILTDRQDALLTKPHDLGSVVIALRDLCSSERLRRAIAIAGHTLYQQSCQWQHRAVEYRDVLQAAIDQGQLQVKADC